MTIVYFNSQENESVFADCIEDTYILKEVRAMGCGCMVELKDDYDIELVQGDYGSFLYNITDQLNSVSFCFCI